MFKILLFYSVASIIVGIVAGRLGASTEMTMVASLFVPTVLVAAILVYRYRVG